MHADSPYWLLSPGDIEPATPAAANDAAPSGEDAVAA